MNKAKLIKAHQPCEDCGSSDALCIYDDDHSYCFSCNTHTRLSSGLLKPMNNVAVIEPFKQPSGDYRSIPDRGIIKDTAEAYGCLADGNNITFLYKDEEGKVVAAKKRTPDKRFTIAGQWDKAGLFGQSLFPKGGKYITITEGEIDAMSCYQMHGSKYPVVSIRNGASAALKDCRNNYEYLSSFDNIIICFDNDEAGTKAANQVAELFGTKCRVVKMRHHKDANEYLVNGDTKEFIDTWWKAEQYVPDGIIAGSALWDEVNKPVEKAACMYPWDGLNKITYGIRPAELVTVTAGSGLGKSQFLREIVWHVLCKTEDNIGLMFLEESVRKTARSIMSLAINKPLHLPDTEATDEELKDAFEQTMGSERIFLFDHFGSTNIDNIINRVRYLAKGLDCKYVFLDHVSIIVSAQESGDERKALDEIMTRLRMLVQETGISLVIVSHLKRPEGKGHEEGTATSLAQLRGSGSIAQLSDMVIGLERNGQADDPVERNTTKVRVLKNRFSGITGKACNLLYSQETGRMLEVVDDGEM